MPTRWARAEMAGWIVLVTGALAVRLVDLASRPFQHDEAQIAYFSWAFAETGDYEYQPVLHGPFMYHATAALFRLLGDSDLVARLPMALAGTAVVALAALLREPLGRGAALAAGTLFAFGPSYLYYSRFEREDIMAAAVTLALLVCVARLLERRPGPLVPIAGVLLALAFTIKETAFITVAVLGGFLVGLAAWQARGHRLRETPVVQALAAPGRRPWLLGLALFSVVYAALFTTFGSNPGGLWDAVYGGPEYWLEQQPLNRGGEDWPFHLLLLASLEWPVLLFGLVGLVTVVWSPAPSGLLFAWTFVASLAIYSWASERFAWLTLHVLVALIPLAGIGVVAACTATRRAVRIGAIVVGVAGAVYLCVSSWVANGPHREDPRSLLVAPQTTEEVLAVRDELLALDRRLRREQGRPLSVDIDSNDGLSYPWAWYLRDLRTGYLDMRRKGYFPDADVVLVSELARPDLRQALAGYRGRRFVLRAFWGRDYSRLSVGAWWRWVARREPWGPLGATRAWIYVREDL